MVKLSQKVVGGGGESDPVYLLSQSRPDKKLKPKREAKLLQKKKKKKKHSYPIASLLRKIATAVWAIMTITVVRTKGKMLPL